MPKPKFPCGQVKDVVRSVRMRGKEFKLIDKHGETVQELFDVGLKRLKRRVAK